MVKGVGPKQNIPRNATGITGKASPPYRSADLGFSAIPEQLTNRMKSYFLPMPNRLENRNIKLGLEDLQKISRAMDKAEAKGARSPLLLYKDVALVASIPNRTIITAVDGSGENEQIFTDIDSAIIFK